MLLGYFDTTYYDKLFIVTVLTYTCLSKNRFYYRKSSDVVTICSYDAFVLPQQSHNIWEALYLYFSLEDGLLAGAFVAGAISATEA